MGDINKKIFIVHGWTYTTNAWIQCLGALRDRGFEPVMLNVPGLTEASDKVWTLEDYEDWLDKKLSGEENVTIVGHSNGGRILIAYAAKHKGKIKNLILIDSAGVLHNEFSLRLKRAVFGSIAKVGKKVVTAPILRKIFYRLIGARDYERASANMRETMKGLIKIDLTQLMKNIDVKTLIIWGDKDKATPLSDGKLMNKLIQNSKFVVVKGAGHSPHSTNPLLVAEEVASWLKVME